MSMDEEIRIHTYPDPVLRANAEEVENIFPEILSLVENFTEKKGNLRPIPLPIIIRAFIGVIFAYYLSESVLQDFVPAEYRENAQDYLVDIYLHGIIKN